MWGWLCPVACSGVRLASPLRSRRSSFSRPPPSLPHQIPRHRDHLRRLPPGTHGHTRRAPLPLSPRALAAGTRSSRRPPSSRRRARRTYRPERCAQRQGTPPPVSARCCDAASRSVACARHGGRAWRHPEPSTSAGRGAAGCAAVPSSPTPALDTPEGSTWAQTTAAWFPAVRREARTRKALTGAREVRDAATHPSMAHRSGAYRLWPTADPRPTAPPRGARVAGRDLSAVSGLDPLETGAAAAPAAREPGRAIGTPVLPEYW